MTLTPDAKLELEKALAMMKNRDVRLEKIMKASDRALKKLSSKELLDEPAAYLANICVELDAEYGIGTTLCLDWMLEQYIAMEFERRVHPWFIELWQALVDGKHTQQNQFEYFSDCEAFHIPHESKRIVVMGSWWKYGGTKVIAIDDTDNENSLFSNFYVRTIWKKSRRDCIGTVDHPTLSCYRKRKFEMKYINEPRWYGDCRDPGHIMTYENMFGKGKCEKTIWDLKAPLRWFFDVNSLWTQLVRDPDDGSGLTYPSDLEKE